MPAAPQSCATSAPTCPPAAPGRPVFGQWLKETEFGEIDKSTRSRLQICIDNLPGIESWRATLPLKRRLELNHPNSVLRCWKAATMPMDRESTMVKTAEPPDVAPNNIAHKPNRAEVLDLSPEHIGETADNFVETFGAHNARRFVAALQAILTPLPTPDPQDPASPRRTNRNRALRQR